MHVYSDVGGVALLDYSGTDKWVKMKRDLGVLEDQDEIFDSVWKKYRNRICIDYDVDLIIKEIESALNAKFTDNYSMLDDFVNRYEKNLSIWPVIQKAKNKYSVGLLTNMYPRLLEAIKTKGLLPDIDWDSVVDSSIVGFQKPDEEIYKIAEKFAGVKPKSIFFIDNSNEHVEAAINRGWNAILYDPQTPEQSSKKVAEMLELVIE